MNAPANCTISSYNVYGSTISGFTPSAATLIANVKGSNYSNTGLTALTTYYYVVKAVGAVGSSKPSAHEGASTEGNTAIVATPVFCGTVACT